MKIATEKLHQKIFDLSQRRRLGDFACDELLGRLLDEADRRAASDDAGDDFYALPELYSR